MTMQSTINCVPTQTPILENHVPLSSEASTLTTLLSNCHEDEVLYGSHVGMESRSCRKCWKKTCEYHLTLSEDIRDVDTAKGACSHCAGEVTAARRFSV
jgi:hypothetical protein